jgi:hypothetical protein
MSIQKEFVVRYRVDGHVRFQIPARICDFAIGKTITDCISSIEGVYRVSLYRNQQKLSIRFHESVCDFKSLAKQLFLLLTELQNNGSLDEKAVSKPTTPAQWKEKTKSKLGSLRATHWLKEKFGDAKETIHAAKIITKLGSKKPKAFIKDPEKAIIDFLNDILVLYLIKLHWHNITQHWIVKPLKYRYEWMALFYMVFLLVRSRRPK